MLKIKSDINEKLLKNFSHESFADITIITASSKYNLTLAYLVIDSEYFNNLEQGTTEVNLSHLPEKPLVQVLRALYGDQLIVYSVVELEQMYRVVRELGIEEYREAIVEALLKNRDLLENLQILEFCTKNDLIVSQVKKVHIDNNLRALESNKNFLQLNKISKSTLIPLLLQYYQDAQQQGATVVNNILQNYFNRNNIRALDFFQQNQDVDVLLGIWEQFHHILHIQKKMSSMRTTMPIKQQSNRVSSMPNMAMTMPMNMTKQQQNANMNAMKKSFMEGDGARTEQNVAKLREKENKIAALQAQIEGQNRVIDKLRKQLFVLKSQGGKLHSTKRIPSNPVLPYDQQDQISLIQANKMTKKDLMLRNIKSQYMHMQQNQQGYQYQYQMGGKPEIQTPGRVVVNRKNNYTDV